jgi:hypothetical protein
VPTLTFQLLYCFFVIEHGRPPDSTFQRYSTSECGVGRATTARDLSGSWPIPLRDPGPRYEIRCPNCQSIHRIWG